MIPTSHRQLTKAFSGKKVLVTGHTGFKGAWLSQWLLELGASVHGYALAPETKPALFDQLGLSNRLEHEIADIRDAEAVRKSIHAVQPDFVFHMAAQPLVRRSYAIPVETYETNVMGTIYVLEALQRLFATGNAPQRQLPIPVIVVTSDKCYENHDSGRAYEESDPLGGHDPYSSSKAMAEIAAAAYRSSYFLNGLIRVATVRAGNVIGGGDWSEDRIVPDAMRALDEGKAISVRNPSAVRPWQHVLEPLGGYLSLAAALVEQPASSPFCGAINFGPGPTSSRTVADLVQEVLKHRNGSWVNGSESGALHEATLLNLSIEKARRLLDWRPVWNFEQTIAETVAWYDQTHRKAVTPLEMTNRQIVAYQSAAKLC